MLALLQLGAGAGATALMLGIGAVSGFLADGIPLFFLLALAVPLFFGVAAGIALNRGRAWSWYAASFSYLLAAASSVFIARGLWRLAPEAPVPAPILAAMPAAFAVLMVVLYGYLFFARSDFGVGTKAGRLGLSAQILIAVAVAVAIPWWASERIEDGVSENRADALQRIGHAGTANETELALLFDRLEHGRELERVSAAWALGQVARREALPRLVSVARDDNNMNVRINAIGSVSSMGGPGVEELLVELLGDGTPEVRAAALRGLNGASSPDSIAAIGPFLEDGDAGIRAVAADVLGRSGSPQAAVLLAAAADDLEEDVRSRIAFGLGKLGQRESVPTLVRMLGDERWEVRANAVQSLGSIGDPGAKADVERMTRDPSGQVRAVAEAALRRFR